MVANIVWVTWNNADIHAQKKAQFHCAIFAKSQRSIFYFKPQEPYKTFFRNNLITFLCGVKMFNFLKIILNYLF